MYLVAKNGARAEDIEICQKQITQAESNIQALEGQLAAARGKVQEIQTYINNTTITAPANGVVTLLNVEVGELILTGMPLAVITDTERPWIKCNVRETDLQNVYLNQKVTVKIPAFPDQEFSGEVCQINKSADFAVKRATNDNGNFDILSYGVKIQLTDLNQPLRAGMTVFVDFKK